MKVIFGTLKDKINSYRNLIKIKKEISTKFETVSKEELDALDDNCAICREKMESAKRLPCSHVFHESCLLRWLEQYNVDHSCPTCRYSLNDILKPQNANDNNGAANPGNNLGNGGDNNHNNQRPGYLRMFNNYINSTVTPDMINQVHAVAPHVPVEIIAEDLRLTRSVDFTLERIFEGVVQIPEHYNNIPPAEDNLPTHSPSHDSKSVVGGEEELKPGFANSKEERQRQLNLRKKLLISQAKKNIKEKNSQPTLNNDATLDNSYDKFDDNNNSYNNDIMMNSNNNNNSMGGAKIETPVPLSPKEEIIPNINNYNDLNNSTTVEDEAAVRRRKMLEAAERRFRLSRSGEEC